MSFQDFMSKVRYWDNICARWMMRHFYTIFFQFVLVIIFLAFFVCVIKSIDLSTHIEDHNMIQQLLFQQSVQTLIIIILLLFNSFWMLYIFNGMNRLRAILKDISFHLSRRKPSQHNTNNDLD